MVPLLMSPHRLTRDNANSARFRRHSQLRSESRYIVSGTPSKNLVGSNDVEDYEVSASAGTRSNADRADFERLANISVFLNLQPFCTEPNPFMRTFFDPYFERGDTTAIADFLSHVMIRHKVPDFVLPPLTRDTVELEFNPLEKLTYNVLLALFASNAVQSERSDVSSWSSRQRVICSGLRRGHGKYDY